MSRETGNKGREIPLETFDLFVKINEENPTEIDLARLERQLASSPESMADYAEVEQLWRALGELAPAESHAPSRRLRYSPPRLAAFALAASLLVAIVLQVSSVVSPPLTVIETGLAERHIRQLDDGSIIHLNAQSRLQVRMGEKRREFVLERGEALFDVAKDPSRPFVVVAGTSESTALGTQFSVRLRDDVTRVTVLEGTVSVFDIKHHRDFVAGQGEQVAINGSSSKRVLEPVHLEKLVSWTDGKLIFSGETLAEAIAEMNRHSHSQIELVGTPADYAGMQVYGVFNIGDSSGFIGALEKNWPLSVRTEESITRISPPSG